MKRFFSASHNTTFNQIDQTFGKRFRMNAQILFIGKIRKHGIRNFPHAGLNGGLIVDQIRNQFPDRLSDIVRRLLLKFQKRRVAFNKCRNLTDVQEAVTQRSGHIGIDFRHHVPRHFRRRLGNIDRNPQTDVAVHIRL